jgi:antitoxin FitA
MSSMTIRKIDDGMKKRLRLRAAGNGRSMEEEVREILGEALKQASPPRLPAKTGLDLFADIRQAAESFGGFELEAFPDEQLQPARRRKSRK